MVLRKIFDQYLSSYQTRTKYIIGFGNNEVLKTLTFVDFEANAGGSITALPEHCSAELNCKNPKR